MTTLYVAGPMTGYPRWNFDAFNDAADALRARGYDVVNPAAVDVTHGFDPDGDPAEYTEEHYHDAMRRDVGLILGVDGVALLPGWSQSRGARFEADLATILGLPVRDWHAWPEVTH